MEEARDQLSTAQTDAYEIRRKIDAEERATGRIGKLNRLKDEFKSIEKKHSDNISEQEKAVNELNARYKELEKEQQKLLKEKDDVAETQNHLDIATHKYKRYGEADMNPWTYKTGGIRGAQPREEVYKKS